MRLLDILKSSGGERSLHSRLGLWMLEVAKRVDQLTAQQATLPQVVLVRLSGQQAVADLSATTALVFQTALIERGSDVTYDPATGFFTLAPNGVYELEASMLWGQYNDPGDSALVLWRDDAGNNLPFPAEYNQAVYYPQDSTVSVTSQPLLKTVVVTSNTALRVQVVQAGGSGAATAQVSSYALVKRLR